MTLVQKSIFISRDLKTDSPFLNDLPDHYALVAFSLLQFSPVSFASIPSVDWIFFYSQNAITFFFKQIDPNTLNLKYAVFGQGTAQALQTFGLRPDFIGTGKGETTAAAFESIAKGAKVLFPRALHSQKTIPRFLSPQVQTYELVVYNNAPKTDFSIPEMDLLVFTSPMNVQAYFGKYSLKMHQSVFAIGATTAQSLKQIGIDKVQVAQQPSDKSLLALIRSMED